MRKYYNKNAERESSDSKCNKKEDGKLRSR